MESPLEQPEYFSPLLPVLAAQRNIASLYEYAATHDALTGLANKPAWEMDIEERITEGKSFLVIFSDLDRFKRINDEFGHGRGDEVLKGFASFMQEKFRRGSDVIYHSTLYAVAHEEDEGAPDTLSRWAGDEFAFTLDLSSNDRRGIDPDTGEKKTIEKRVSDALAFFDAAFDEFVETQPEEIRRLGFNVSFGHVAFDPSEPRTAAELFATVDKQMTTHKQGHQDILVDALPLPKKVARKIGNAFLRYAGAQPQR